MVYVVCVCGLNACVYSVSWVRGHWVGGVGKVGLLFIVYGRMEILGG